MWFYINLAIIISGIIYFAGRVKGRGIKFCLFLAGILIPSVIGGFRDLTIGTDLGAYGTEYYNWVRYYTSIFDFFKQWPTKEYGYGLLCYLGYALGNEIHAYLFLSELIKMSLVVYTAYSFRKKLNAPIFILIYMLFMYWNGLSMMRQSIALDICLFSLTFFFRRKYLKYTICILIAYFFHSSAITFLFLPFLQILYVKSKHPVVIGLFGLFIFGASIMPLFLFIASTGLMKDELVDLYLDSGVASAKIDILIAIFMLIMPFAMKFNKKRKRRMTSKHKQGGFKLTQLDNMEYLCVMCSALALFFLSLSSMFEVAFRMAYYPTMVLLIIVPILIKRIRKEKIRLSYNTILVVLYFMYIAINANHGLADTMPYKSSILGI